MIRLIMSDNSQIEGMLVSYNYSRFVLQSVSIDGEKMLFDTLYVHISDVLDFYSICDKNYFDKDSLYDGAESVANKISKNEQNARRIERDMSKAIDKLMQRRK